MWWKLLHGCCCSWPNNTGGIVAGHGQLHMIDGDKLSLLTSARRGLLLRLLLSIARSGLLGTAAAAAAAAAGVLQSAMATRAGGPRHRRTSNLSRWLWAVGCVFDGPYSEHAQGTSSTSASTRSSTLARHRRRLSQAKKWPSTELLSSWSLMTRILDCFWLVDLPKVKYFIAFKNLFRDISSAGNGKNMRTLYALLKTR